MHSFANQSPSLCRQGLGNFSRSNLFGFFWFHCVYQNYQPIKARQKHKHIVEFLLSDKIININARTNGGCTPLHRAAITGDHSLLNIFLSQTAVDLSAVDHEGQNFLHKLAKSRISADILENYFAKFPDQARISDNYSKLPSGYR